MKNKLRFLVFLISRFKGIIIYAIGLGIFIVADSIIVPLIVPFHMINDSISIYVIFFWLISLVLMLTGQWIRHNSKKILKAKQTPS
jgi:hypothetical protein